MTRDPAGGAGQKMPRWWNGRHGRLKPCCWQQHEGSSPSLGTTRRSGVIGRRTELKSPWEYSRAGSSPASDTIPFDISRGRAVGSSQASYA